MKKVLFEGDDKYRAPIMEDKGIWSVVNMDDEELRTGIIEQALVLYMDYQRQQFTFEEFISSLRVEDCIETYKRKFNSESAERLCSRIRSMGTNLYWRIWERVYTATMNLVKSGHLILVKEDLSFRKKGTILRLFSRDTTLEGIRNICQNLMNECGCWWEGYTIPDGVNVVSLTEKGKELLANNSIEDITAMFAHEMMYGETDKNIN